MFRGAAVRYAVRGGDHAGVEDALTRTENRRWADRIGALDIPEDAAAVSSRRVRELLARGEDVTALVPEEVPSFLPSGRP